VQRLHAVAVWSTLAGFVDPEIPMRSAPQFRRHVLALAALWCGFFLSATAADMSAAGIPAFSDAMLSPDYWIRRAPAPDAVLLDARATAAQRAAAYAPGGGFLDIRQLPATLTRAQVVDWIRAAEQSPVKLAVDDAGHPVGPDTVQALRADAAADRIAAAAPARYGLAVRRAPMRTFPSDRAFYAAADQRDYESLTAGTLFPGEPVLIAHASADGRWLLAVTTQGPAWVPASDIAIGPAATVFGYAAQPPGRVVTGDHVRTVFTPELPAVSALDLDMGVALPRADVPPDAPVNGASPYASWAVQLPVRAADGTLTIRPALIRRSADTADGYLRLTRANILRQAFKFLGERYGWGHQFDARDCSGLISETYRSMGLLLQHSSALQGTSTALKHRTFTDRDGHAARVQALKEAQVGDLVVVPGHVLMVIGHVNGEPYVIQDVPYAVFKDPAGGGMRRTKLNQVSVTPLLPLYADDTTLYVDAMTSLVQPTRGQP
jgi:cell wall-associated NlpC family hydrolase